jgi:hypothetical protein
MAHKIGVSGSEYTLPVAPEAGTYEVGAVPLAGMTRALDGTALTHYVADKRRWAGHWSGLTTAQRDFIMAELRRQAHLSWYPYEEPTTQYTVRVVNGYWVPTPNAPAYYDVHFELEQV